MEVRASVACGEALQSVLNKHSASKLHPESVPYILLQREEWTFDPDDEREWKEKTEALFESEGNPEFTVLGFHATLDSRGIACLWGELGPSKKLTQILSFLRRPGWLCDAEFNKFWVNLGEYRTALEMVGELRIYNGDTSVVVQHCLIKTLKSP